MPMTALYRREETCLSSTRSKFGWFGEFSHSEGGINDHLGQGLRYRETYGIGASIS